MPQRFANAIRSFRLQKRPSQWQRDLGVLIGVTQSDVSDLERGGVPSLQKALEIAAALGRPVEAVFYAQAEEAMERVAKRSAANTAARMEAQQSPTL